MKDALKRVVIAVLIPVILACPATVRAAEEPSLASQCAVYLIGAGMLLAYVGSGGAIASQIARQRGWFESETAYHERQERNDRRATPFLVGGAALASLGIVILIVNGIRREVPASISQQSDDPTRAHLHITDVAEGVRIFFRGKEIEISEEGEAQLRRRSTTNNTIVFKLRIEINGKQPKSVDVEVPVGTRLTLSFKSINGEG